MSTRSPSYDINEARVVVRSRSGLYESAVDLDTAARIGSISSQDLKNVRFRDTVETEDGLYQPRHGVDIRAEPETLRSSEVAVVVDDASKTYRVRSTTASEEKKGIFGRLSRAVGTGWAEVDALNQLSFIVRRGESVGVIGTNGSGKSTLMKLLTGKIRPTTGEVYATSTPVMLGVNAALVKQLSGRENIRLGCLAMGLTPKEASEKFEHIVELSGLRDSLHLPLKSYSSGMSSRLQFAIATAVDPDILLIDEALNTGDANFRARTAARLAEVRAQAGCVFLVSHSLGTIRQMCSRVIWIEQGQILADGDPDWVTAQYKEYTDHMSAGRYKFAQLVYDRCRLRLEGVSVQFAGGESPK